MEIQESNDKNEEEGVGAIHKLIEVVTYIGEIIKITQKEMQPQMATQHILFPSSSQSGLGNLPVSVPRNIQNLQWKMDQKTLAKKGIKIPNENRYFFTPTKQNYSK